MRFSRLIVAGFALQSICCGGTASAASREPFFDANQAGSVFTEEVLRTEDPFEHFPQRKQAEEPLPEEQEPNLVLVGAAVPPSDQKPAESASIEVLISKYGDPAEDQPVLAQESAPKPFRAMMEAKQLGQDELAYRYAKQYARYLKNLKNRTMQVTGLIGKAMVAEKILPRESWASSSQFEEADRFLEADLAEQEKLKAEITNAEELEVSVLDDEARALLDRAKAEEEAAGAQLKEKDDAQPGNFDEKAERQKVRAQLAGRVPQALDGKVDVFLFFRGTDPDAQEATRAVEALHRTYAGSPDVRVVGLSLDSMTSEELEAFAWNNGATFPVRAGVDAARRAGVSKSPTVLIMPRSGDEVLREEGVRRFYYLDEVVKVMRGR